MVRPWVRRTAERLSQRLAGASAWAGAAVLTVLAVVGNLTAARDILGVQVGTTVLAGVGVLVIVVNWVYRLYRRAAQAENQRDAAHAALLARPDPTDAVRLFLRLYDEGPQVLEQFDANVEALPETMPVGRQQYHEWIARCTAAIHEHRPAYALRFRESEAAAWRGAGPRVLVVPGADGRKRYVNLDEAEHYKTLVKQSMAVLADIVKAG